MCTELNERVDSYVYVFRDLSLLKTAEAAVRYLSVELETKRSKLFGN